MKLYLTAGVCFLPRSLPPRTAVRGKLPRSCIGGLYIVCKRYTILKYYKIFQGQPACTGRPLFVLAALFPATHEPP